MRILSHRGYWKTPEEKNTPAAFERSFGLGFGTETDLRDFADRIVVAHDPPGPDALDAQSLFDIHARHDASLTLALNVKADGLQRRVRAVLDDYEVTDAFVFDMSVPDTLQWSRAGFPFFTRHSDIEPEPTLYEEAAGVWLDAFRSDWWDVDVIERHLNAHKRVCIVSPELHGRDHASVWAALARRADFVEMAGPELMICTDLPEAAAKELRQ